MVTTVDMTEEQRNAIWQQAGSQASSYIQSLTSVVATPIAEGIDFAANSLNTINHATPSIIPGRPMTDFIGDPLNNPMERLGNAITDGLSNMAGEAQKLLVIKEIGETPDAMIEKMAANPALQTEDGQKLIQIMKNDPEFTQAFHSAMINEPTMAPGILDLMKAEGGADNTTMKDMVDGLADDGNRATFTQVLDAVATNPDLDFKYTMDVVDASNAIGQEDAKPEDYKRLQTLLAKSGVKNLMLDFAVDPMAALQDAMKDPSAFFDQLAQMINLEGPIGDMFRGVVQGMGQYVELIASPEIKEFYDKRIDPLVQDIPNAMAQLDGSAAKANPTSPAQVNGNINVDGLAGADNDIEGKISAVYAFDAARFGQVAPETSPAFKPVVQQPSYDTSRAFGLN